MQKCFLLAVCLIQQALLIAQTEKSLQYAQRSALEATQIMDTNTGKVTAEGLYGMRNK